MRSGSPGSPGHWTALSALFVLALYAQHPPPASAQLDPSQPIDGGLAGDGEEALPGQVPRAAIGVQTDMESRFGELDVDASGGLSEDEVRGDIELRQQFETLDANHDGQLQASEFTPSLGR